jgi:predicted Zn-dependent protease
MSRTSLPLALIAAALAAAPAAAQFPSFDSLVKGAESVKKGADAVRPIGEPEEVAIGAELAATLLGAAPLVPDPAMQAYVNKVGTWLAMQSERPGLKWKFGVIASNDVNAFATPGGHVLITKGLYDRLRNESELAGTLAHEISHVVRKHQLKALQSALSTEALQGIASTAGSVAGNATLSNASQVIKGGKELFLRGLDKEDEYEADRMGAVIAARGGYSPYGLVGVLQTLSASPTDGAFALLFKTHPTPVSRLERLGAAMGTKLDSLPNAVDDTPGFALLRNPPPPPPAPPPPPPKPKPKAKKR